MNLDESKSPYSYKLTWTLLLVSFVALVVNFAFFLDIKEFREFGIHSRELELGDSPWANLTFAPSAGLALLNFGGLAAALMINIQG